MRLLRVLAAVVACSVVLTALAWLLANNQALRARFEFWLHQGSTQHLPLHQNHPGSYLVVPRLGLDVPLRSPASDDPAMLLSELEHGVVRYPQSAAPGQPGLLFVVGHSSSYAWAPGEYKAVFALLDQLSPGDEVSVAEGGQLYRYRVTGSLTVSPSDLSVLDPPLGGQRLLRLMTCWPVGTTLQRLVVEAEFVPRAGG